MNKQKIMQKAAKEINKRVSAVSNLQKDIQGVKSDLLDILFLEGSKKERKEYENIIKRELEKKIDIAKNHTPPRTKYIENMQRIIKDLDARFKGNKTDDNREQLLDLDKKRGFNSEILKEIGDTTITDAAKENKEQEKMIKRLGKRKEYKDELARLLEHRSDEVTDDLQKNNIQILIKKIRNVQEIEKTTKKRNTKLQNMITTVRLLAALGLTTRGTIGYFENQKKEVKKGMQAETPMMAKNNKFPKSISVSRERLQQAISDTLLEEGITYKDIADAVNGTTNEDTKKTIKKYLYAGDILGLQEFLCMKKNSEYELNKATGRIDKNTMAILQGGRFGMTEKEIMADDTITQDVKDAYLEFVKGIRDNNDENYMIDSKLSKYSFILDTKHRLIDVQPILIGRDEGKDQEYVPFTRFYENGIKKYYKDADPKELNRNTPEGLFAIEGIDKLKDRQYQVNGPKEAIIMDPIEFTTPGLTYDKKRVKMRDHPVFVAEGPGYVEALNTPTTADNNKSKGCINHKNFGRVKDNLKTDPNGSRIFVTQYTKYKNQEKQKNLYASNFSNNKRNYFPPIRGK